MSPAKPVGRWARLVLAVSLTGGIAQLGPLVGPASAQTGVAGSTQWITSVSGGLAAAGTITFGTSGVTAALGATTHNCASGSNQQIPNSELVSRNANLFFTPAAPSDAVGVVQCITASTSATRPVVFNKPVIDPIFSVNNLDASNLIFGAGPSGGPIQLTALSSDPTLLLEASGTELHNTVASVGTNPCSSSPGAFSGCGSFQMTESGGPVSSFTLDNVNPNTADGWFWTLAFPMATLAKSFVPASVAPGGTSTLTFTLANPSGAGAVDLSSLGFTDALASGLGLANATSSDNGSCGTPVISDPSGNPLVTGATAVKVEDVDLAVGATCTISVDVTAAATGTYTNDNSNLSTTLGNLVPDASTTLTVAPTVGAHLGDPKIGAIALGALVTAGLTFYLFRRRRRAVI